MPRRSRAKLAPTTGLGKSVSPPKGEMNAQKIASKTRSYNPGGDKILRKIGICGILLQN